MSFCTVINCMDGRVQLPIIEYMQATYGVPYVDAVTEPGPVSSLARPVDPEVAASVLRRLGVSVDTHGSRVVAVVGHHDCTGNRVDKERQRVQTEESVDYVAEHFPALLVVGLWVDEHGVVSEITRREPVGEHGGQ